MVLQCVPGMPSARPKNGTCLAVYVHLPDRAAAADAADLIALSAFMPPAKPRRGPIEAASRQRDPLLPVAADRAHDPASVVGPSRARGPLRDRAKSSLARLAAPATFRHMFQVVAGRRPAASLAALVLLTSPAAARARRRTRRTRSNGPLNRRRHFASASGRAGDPARSIGRSIRGPISASRGRIWQRRTARSPTFRRSASTMPEPGGPMPTGSKVSTKPTRPACSPSSASCPRLEAYREDPANAAQIDQSRPRRRRIARRVCFVPGAIMTRW